MRDVRIRSRLARRPLELSSTEENRLEFVVDSSESQGKSLADYLKPFGYDVQAYRAVAYVRESIIGALPAAFPI